ncbi:MAG: type II toxin-antitoxin system death-on-curing family toxin [Chloroflexota bacterium]|nr:type II toxin-antitoxin system death-on-curing family toxin [Chloroflexota bacterium]
MTIRYLTTEQVIALHKRVLEAMGWHAAPLRSEHLLASAVQRTQAAAFYGGADLVDQACVLAVGISQNQPFLDGNKRTATHCLVVFLDINGIDYVGDEFELADQVLAVAEREGSLDEATTQFAAWLRGRTVARE